MRNSDKGLKESKSDTNMFRSTVSTERLKRKREESEDLITLDYLLEVVNLKPRESRNK